MKKKIVAFLAGVALLIGMTTTASALSIMLDDGINGAMILNDSTPVLDFNPAKGAVTYIGRYGNYDISVTTGISTSGSASSPFMDLNSINLTNASGTASALRIYLTDTNFTGIVPAFIAHIGGTTSGTVEYKTYYDMENRAFAETTLLTSQKFSGPSFSGDAVSSILSLTGSPYSLTQEVFISGTGVTGFNATIAPVPEPGTMVLLGAGLLGLAIFGKRRMNKS